jgi:hypothetical protein
LTEFEAASPDMTTCGLLKAGCAQGLGEKPDPVRDNCSRHAQRRT